MAVEKRIHDGFKKVYTETIRNAKDCYEENGYGCTEKEFKALTEGNPSESTDYLKLGLQKRTVKLWAQANHAAGQLVNYRQKAGAAFAGYKNMMQTTRNGLSEEEKIMTSNNKLRLQPILEMNKVMSDLGVEKEDKVMDKVGNVFKQSQLHDHTPYDEKLMKEVKDNLGVNYHSASGEYVGTGQGYVSAPPPSKKQETDEEQAVDGSGEELRGDIDDEASGVGMQ